MNKKFTEQDMHDYGNYVANLNSAMLSPNFEKWCKERFEPAKKVIDLSLLNGSRIDCEFSDEPDFLQTNTGIATLKNVGRGPSYYASNSPNQYLYCQPRMNHKHAWPEGECPLPEGFEVKVWFRSGGHTVVTTRSGNYWGINGDTMCFEVLRVADGYVMPWEQDND